MASLGQVSEHGTYGKASAAGSTIGCSTHIKHRSLTAVFGLDSEQEDEINRHSDMMKDSVEAQITEQGLIDAGIEPEDVRDLKVSKQHCSIELWGLVWQLDDDDHRFHSFPCSPPSHVLFSALNHYVVMLFHLY